MWKIVSNAHRTLLGGFRASLRDDYQTVQGQRVLNILNGSGYQQLSSAPNILTTNASNIRGSKGFSANGVTEAFFCRHNHQGQEECQDGWSLFEAFHYSTALALTYNLVHQQKENSRLTDCCPVVAYKASTCLLAQPIHNLQSEFNHISANLQNEFSSLSLDGLSTSESPVKQEYVQAPQQDVAKDIEHKDHVKFYVGDHDSSYDDHDESQSNEGNDEIKVSTDNISAVEEFELELQTMEGVKLLEEGNPGGVGFLRAQTRRGSSVASFYLGMAYEQGHLVPRNLTTARMYYETSADRGNPEAQYNLAVFYIDGKGGLRRDEAKARSLLKQAAEGGCSQARTALGLDQQDIQQGNPDVRDGKNLYMLGRSFEGLGETGVALDFYSMAADAGYSRAKRAKDRLASQSF